MTTISKITTNKGQLDTWEFSPQEWNLFVKEAKILKKEDNRYFGAAILIAGIPFLMFFRNTGFLIAVIFVLPFAILLPYLRNKIAKTNSILKETTKEAYVTFYSEFLDVNGTRVDLFSDKKWIKNMMITPAKKGLQMLEIEIAWHTRKGNTFDETRVPIPTEKLEKAKELIEYYRFYK
jgi:predicted membrane protein